MTPYPAADLHAAIAEAEARALTDHRAGTCHLSEWTCSHCEAATTAPGMDDQPLGGITS